MDRYGVEIDQIILEFNTTATECPTVAGSGSDDSLTTTATEHLTSENDVGLYTTDDGPTTTVTEHPTSENDVGLYTTATKHRSSVTVSENKEGPLNGEEIFLIVFGIIIIVII